MQFNGERLSPTSWNGMQLAHAEREGKRRYSSRDHVKRLDDERGEYERLIEKLRQENDKLKEELKKINYIKNKRLSYIIAI